MEAACVSARAARLAGDVTDFFKYAMKAVTAGGCAEICYELGAFYMEREDYDEAVIWLYNAAYETESVLNIHSGGIFRFGGWQPAIRRLEMKNRRRNIPGLRRSGQREKSVSMIGWEK